jgi:hypothetical protein
MSTLEKKIADVVLKRIRAARSNGHIESVPETEPKIAQPVSVRQARFSDFDQVFALNTKLGLGPDSAENWKRLWLENPALLDGETPVIGWVLETSNGIVGFLGSIPLQYEYEGKTVRAVVASRFAVDVAYRSFSHLLIISFFRQKNVDLFLNTTATVSAGKMMLAFKAAPIPQADYGDVLFWIIDSGYFTKSVFDKLGIGPGLRAARSLVSLGIRVDIGLRRRTPRGGTNKYSVSESNVNDIGNEFQEFWLAKSNETSRLQAKRSPSIMRWHFDPPRNRHIAKVVACYLGNRLVGYGIVRHYTSEKEGLRRSLVADLMIEGDDPCIVEQLLAAMYKSASNAGTHVLEVMGFPKEIRQMFTKSKPYFRKYPACPFFYKAKDRALHERLTDENVWYACPFDGDGTIFP